MNSSEQAGKVGVRSLQIARFLSTRSECRSACRAVEQAKNTLNRAIDITLVKYRSKLKNLNLAIGYACDSLGLQTTLTMLIDSGVDGVDERYRDYVKTMLADLIKLQELKLRVSKAEENYHRINKFFQSFGSDIVNEASRIEFKKSFFHYLPRVERAIEDIRKALILNVKLDEKPEELNPSLCQKLLDIKIDSGDSLPIVFLDIYTKLLYNAENESFSNAYNRVELFWVEFTKDIESFLAQRAIRCLDDEESKFISKYMRLKSSENVSEIAKIFSSIFLKIKDDVHFVESRLNILGAMSISDSLKETSLQSVHANLVKSIWPMTEMSDFQQITDFLNALIELAQFNTDNQEVIELKEKILKWVQQSFGGENLTTYFKSCESIDVDIVSYMIRLRNGIAPLCDPVKLQAIEGKIKNEATLATELLAKQIKYAHILITQINSNRRDSVWDEFLIEGKVGKIPTNPSFNNPQSIASSVIEVPLSFLSTYLKTLFSREDYTLFV